MKNGGEIINLDPTFYDEPKEETKRGVGKRKPKTQGELKAYCTSEICNPYKNGEYGYSVKDVKKNQDFCPDCSSALFWTRSKGLKYHFE